MGRQQIGDIVCVHSRGQEVVALTLSLSTLNYMLIIIQCWYTIMYKLHCTIGVIYIYIYVPWKDKGSLSLSHELHPSCNNNYGAVSSSLFLTKGPCFTCITLSDCGCGFSHISFQFLKFPFFLIN